MKRVFSSYRPFGPLFKSSNMYSSNEDRYLTRLSESGAESITTTQVGDRLVIDFLTIGDEPSKEFSSTVSISDGEVGSCLLRLPHVVAGPDVWHRMSYDIAEVIDRTTDIDPYEGLLKRERSMTGIVQSAGVVIRPNDGFNNPDNNVLTPHISFDAFDTSGDNVTILASFDEIARTIEELNQMWNTSYSDLETVETKNII